MFILLDKHSDDTNIFLLLSLQGNVIKATSILHKAQALNARPAELLEMAVRNLKAGEKRLMPSREEEEEPPAGRGEPRGAVHRETLR